MMERLRESATGLGMKIILGLIILSFLIGGVSSYLISGGDNTAAKVNGTEITLTMFEQTYAERRTMLQQQLGDSFFEAMSDPQSVAMMRQNVLLQMISDELLTQYANELDLVISDKQVSEIIALTPAFQQTGRFDQVTFETVVANNYSISTNKFAQMLKTQLLNQQLRTFMNDSEFILDTDVQVLAELQNQKREVQTVLIDINDYLQPEAVTDDEINNYYQQNRVQFDQPEQIKISYLKLSGDMLKNHVMVTEEDLQTYYQENQSQYLQRAARQIAHIQVQDEQTAKEILDKIKAGEDFAALAKQYSIDTGTASEGGAMGWVEQGSFEESFDNAVFALATPGDVSDVVFTSGGYHIIKLTDVREEQQQSFAQVKDEIRNLLIDEKAANEFYRIYGDLKNAAYDYPESLAESAKLFDGEIKTTDFVSLDKLPEELNSPDIISALQNQDVRDGYNSDVLELAAENVMVVRVDEVKESYTIPLEQVSSEIRNTLAMEKAIAQVNTLAEQLVGNLKNGDDSGLAENNLTFSAPQIVTRQDPLQVFSMPTPVDGKSTYAKLNDENNNIVVAKLNKVITADISQQALQEVKSQQYNQLLQKANIRLINSLYQDASIEVYTQ